MYLESKVKVPKSRSCDFQLSPNITLVSVPSLHLFETSYFKAKNAF